MKRDSTLPLVVTAACLALSPAWVAAGQYRNFEVSVYCRAYEVREMSDLVQLEARWAAIEKAMRVDKVYLETHRDMLTVDEATLKQARAFFERRGLRTAGGITATVDERNRFQTFCYSNPDHRRHLKAVVELTARNFDELILDDFFFTSCKCLSCIKAKGTRSWTRFRLDLMDEAARTLVIAPARAVNPKITLVIKYPNWYEHYQHLGYDLETEPRLFDRIYTGTETRDPVYNNQHLQPYHGYSIFRYLENVKPGGNGGGWVDPPNRRTLDRYAEQLWLTLFAKAPEITLFDYRQLVQPIRQEDGSERPDTLVGRVAGYVFDQVDGFIGQLGRPLGLRGYKPYHSSGEDHLHSFLGMVGIPIELTPEFPAEDRILLLTESAKLDPSIVERIKGQLTSGKDVVITSGLLRALQGRGIEDIVELEYTDRKALTKAFRSRFVEIPGETEVAIPQIRYATNDAWENISSLTAGVGAPLLIEADYGGGHLFVLTIPESFGDLYNLPAEVLNQIRATLTRHLFVRIEGPSQVALFVYDNDTFIVESFLPHAARVRLVLDKRFSGLRELLSGRELSGQAERESTVFDTFLIPHSYQVFKAQKAPAAEPQAKAGD